MAVDLSSDLTLVVDAKGKVIIMDATDKAESTAGRPVERCLGSVKGIVIIAHHVSGGVNRPGSAARRAICPEVDHASGRRPDEGVDGDVIGEVGVANDLATIVDAKSDAGVTSERPEIRHPGATVPDEGVLILRHRA